MKTTPLKAAALAGAMAAAFAGASLAQPAPGPGGPEHRMMTRERPDPAEMMARHAQRMRDLLQLTPRQEPALQELLRAMQPSGDMRQRMGEQRQEMQGLTTPERLDRMHQVMLERQSRFEARAAAIKRFYAQLTPSQQKAFDAMHPMGGHRGKGGMGRGGMRHGGMGHGGRMGGMDGRQMGPGAD